jgi:hypothetical protein
MTLQERKDLIAYCEYPFWDRLPSIAPCMDCPPVKTQIPETMGRTLPVVRCFPNPVRNFAKITLENMPITQKDRVFVSIYNIQGKMLFCQTVQPGQTVVKWDASGYGSGKYFTKVVANGTSYRKDVLLIR